MRQEPSSNPNDEDAAYDEAPTFIDMNSAVEVDVSANVPDDDDMMEDDAMTDIAKDKASSSSQQQPTPPQASAAAPPIVYQSRATFSSYADAIYANASHYNLTIHTLSIASGGGDDRAFLHKIATSAAATGNNDTTMQTATMP